MGHGEIEHHFLGKRSAKADIRCSRKAPIPPTTIVAVGLLSALYRILIRHRFGARQGSYTYCTCVFSPAPAFHNGWHDTNGNRLEFTSPAGAGRRTLRRHCRTITSFMGSMKYGNAPSSPWTRRPVFGITAFSLVIRCRSSPVRSGKTLGKRIRGFTTPAI